MKMKNKSNLFAFILFKLWKILLEEKEEETKLIATKKIHSDKVDTKELLTQFLHHTGNQGRWLKGISYL